MKSSDALEKEKKYLENKISEIISSEKIFIDSIKMLVQKGEVIISNSQYGLNEHEKKALIQFLQPYKSFVTDKTFDKVKPLDLTSFNSENAAKSISAYAKALTMPNLSNALTTAALQLGDFNAFLINLFEKNPQIKVDMESDLNPKNIGSYTIMPIQRGPRYELFSKDLIESTKRLGIPQDGSSINDLTSITNTLKKMNATAARFAEQRSLMEGSFKTQLGNAKLSSGIKELIEKDHNKLLVRETIAPVIANLEKIKANEDRLIARLEKYSNLDKQEFKQYRLLVQKNLLSLRDLLSVGQNDRANLEKRLIEVRTEIRKCPMPLIKDAKKSRRQLLKMIDKQIKIAKTNNRKLDSRKVRAASFLPPLTIEQIQTLAGQVIGSRPQDTMTEKMTLKNSSSEAVHKRVAPQPPSRAARPSLSASKTGLFSRHESSPLAEKHTPTISPRRK